MSTSATTMHIPFNKPFIAGKELYYIAQAVGFANLAGDGEFTRRCSRLLEDHFGISKVLLTPSCTAALELAGMILDLGPGDEVIMPSFTFVSTANSVVRVGASPVFVDVRPDTLNIDEELIERAITPRTRAIFVVHYAGVGCEMDRIAAIARKHSLVVVEDAAQGVNAFYKNRALGSLGALGAYSFHETKNYICGQGGALCLNSPEYVERASNIRNKGTNRDQFFLGAVDKYTWVDVGSAFVPSEINSAFLCSQLELLDVIAERRREIYEFYYSRLQPLQNEGLLELPIVPAHCESNFHMFHVRVRDRETRDDLLADLRGDGIDAVFHYVPLHNSPMGMKFGYKTGDLPVTESASERLVRLPFFHEITPDEQLQVVRSIERSLARRSAAVTVF